MWLSQAMLLRGLQHGRYCQSMKGCVPRDCLISAYLHLLAKHSLGWTETEVHRHTGTLQMPPDRKQGLLPGEKVNDGQHFGQNQC